MGTYKYICRTTTSGHTWKLIARFPSHAMALEYGSMIAKDFAICHWFVALDVWLVEPQSFVGSITISNEPIAIINPAD